MATSVAAAPSKPFLFSVHGIYTDGDWQEGAKAVLSPFYEYRIIKYPHFRKWAVLKLAGDILSALCFAAMALFLWRMKILVSPLLWFLYLLTAIVSVCVLRWYAASLRSDAIKKVHLEITAETSNLPYPSVVAHSLGTLLICSAFAKYSDLYLKTIILDGCVVSRQYPWNAKRFHRVFNEVGGRDQVPFAARLLSGTIKWMGAAGRRGFRGSYVDTENVDPDTERFRCSGARNACCEAHVPSGSQCEKKVHNIFFKH